MAGCQACRTALAAEGNGRAVVVDDAHPAACGCEQHKVRDLSPGPVADGEFLVRIVVDPCHVTDKDGTPRPKSSVFSESYSCGTSCLREGHATPEQYRRTVELLLEGRPRDANGRVRGVFGVVRFPASAARSFEEEIDGSNPGEKRKERRFCVYDTAEPDRNAHAEVFYTISRQPGPSKAQRFTRKLYDATSDDFVPVDEFLDGLLMPYSVTEREKDLAPSVATGAAVPRA